MAIFNKAFALKSASFYFSSNFMSIVLDFLPLVDFGGVLPGDRFASCLMGAYLSLFLSSSSGVPFLTLARMDENWATLTETKVLYF